jgi:hypothetical protein
MATGTDFSQAAKDEITKRSGGVCECIRKTHSHTGRCKSKATEYHHVIAKDKGGQGVASNGEHLCSTCHYGTGSYGGS